MRAVVTASPAIHCDLTKLGVAHAGVGDCLPRLSSSLTPVLDVDGRGSPSSVAHDLRENNAAGAGTPTASDNVEVIILHGGGVRGAQFQGVAVEDVDAVLPEEAAAASGIARHRSVLSQPPSPSGLADDGSQDAQPISGLKLLTRGVLTARSWVPRTILRPAFATRMLMSVSISNPSPHRRPSPLSGVAMPSRGRAPGCRCAAQMHCSRSTGRCTCCGKAGSAEAEASVPQCPDPRDVRTAASPRLRLPFAKSAPSTRASTKRGISAGSADPSASSITMMSPVHAAKPQCRGRFPCHVSSGRRPGCRGVAGAQSARVVA